MIPPMDLIVYYEGANSIESWVSKLLPGYTPTFKKLPTSNKQEKLFIEYSVIFVLQIYL